MASIGRRDFLKLFGAALASPFFKPDEPEEPEPEHPTGLGRVTDWQIWAYDKPLPGSVKLKALPRDTVLEIHDSVSTEGLLSHNPTWLLTPFGWVYSSWVQPVRRQLNEVVRYVPEGGFWAQVTLPYVEMRSRPDENARRLYRLYYSSAHLVVAHVEDELGRSWYQLRDDQSPGRPEYVQAEGLRMIPPGELSPISPHVEDKLIQVSTKYQMLYAYENGRLVFSARCATGASFHVAGLGRLNYWTPRGKHEVVSKRPSRHMTGARGRSDFYDLPGVPFCTYLTASGVAVHGTYWHNDYGHPRSHGCINVLAEEALWVYRWSHPPAGYADIELKVEEGGTPIVVT